MCVCYGFYTLHHISHVNVMVSHSAVYHTDLFLIHTLTLSILFEEDEWDGNKDLELVQTSSTPLVYSLSPFPAAALVSIILNEINNIKPLEFCKTKGRLVTFCV